MLRVVVVSLLLATLRVRASISRCNANFKQVHEEESAKEPDEGYLGIVFELQASWSVFFRVVSENVFNSGASCFV